MFFLSLSFINLQKTPEDEIQVGFWVKVGPRFAHDLMSSMSRLIWWD